MFKRTKISSCTLLALGGIAAVTAVPTLAQEAQRVEITGSSIKRLAVEGALPVTVVTRSDIEKSGVSSTEELLLQITSVSSAGGQVNAGMSGLSTYGQSAVSLRGLGSDKTLVLVNGRRLAVFAGIGDSVNVNAIPLGAIERIEVLQDGASGIYGSDAIGGVVNFILRKDAKGIELSATYGAPTRGGGAVSKKVGVVAGFGDYDKNRFSVTASAAFEKEGNLLGAARPFSASDTNLPFYAGGATETGRIEGTWLFPGQGTLFGAGPNGRSATNPFGVSGTGYGNPNAASGTCEAIGMVPRSGRGFSGPFVPPPGTALRTAPNCTFDTGRFVSLVPNREFTGITLNGRFKLSENAELFADGMYAKNEFTNPIQPAPLRQAFYAGNTRFAGSGVDPILLIYPSNPNYQVAANYLNSIGLGAMVGSPLGVSQRTFLLGPRTTNDIATQDRIVLGIRGSLSGLDYEAAYMQNTSKTSCNVIDGFASIFELTRVLNNPANNWNPWAPLGQQAPALAALIDGTKYKGPTIRSTSTNNGVDAKVSGSGMSLGGGAIGWAAGIQARDEKYKLDPAAATQTGDIIGLGGAIERVDANRSVWAMFTEVNLPISKAFEANLALRQDSYSDFGKTLNWKASARFQPSQAFLARASVGTGFKAPSLPDLYTPQQINTTEQFTDPRFPGNGQIQVTSLGGGNPNLGPEKSDQFSAGIVFSPTRSITASVDYFSIDIKGLIATPSAQEIASGFRRGAPGYAALVDVNGADEITLIRQLAANVSSLKAQGVDVDLRWRENMAGGRVDVGLNGTWMTKYDLVNTSGETEQSVGTIVRPDGSPLVAAGTGVILRWKHNLSAGYSTDSWSATLTQRFYKGYEDGNDLDANRHFVKSQALYDLVASYTGIKNLKLTLGVRNLFDKDPPLFINNGSQFQSGYDVYQYDPRGRFVYVSGNYKF